VTGTSTAAPVQGAEPDHGASDDTDAGDRDRLPRRRSTKLVVSGAALDAGVGDRYALTKRAAAVKGCRVVGKRDMKLNDALPKIEVDAETYTVRADGEVLRATAAAVLPLAQRYFLF
jgi:urease subunit alpha